jgi:aspartyl-tRNA(Asn)/glutamyl-tRNA(Gln) amidotransferase subunit C
MSTESRSACPSISLKRAGRTANAARMSVTRETVAKIASLARIRMDEPALDRMVPEFNAILAWVEQLGEVDVAGVEPMTAVIPQQLRLRDDVVDADPLTGGGVREAVLANAPAAEHGFYGVPKVIE